MGGACSAYGGEENLQGFGGKTCGKDATWEIPDVEGRIILRWILRKWHERAWTGSS